MTTALGEFRVWVMPGYIAGNTAYFPWSLSALRHEPRLIPERVSNRASGMGSASFRWLRALREENGSTFYDAGYARVGAYVAVTAGVTAFSLSSVIFWGYLRRADVEQVAYGTDKTGSVTALGLGYILDGTQLTGFRQGEDGAASEAFTTPPTFNLQADGGAVVGNKVIDAAGVPVFASLPSECSASALWSRLAVFEHVLTYCTPNGMPTLGATGSAAVSTYLDSTSTKEIFELGKLTLKGAIDLLVSRAHGFGWDVRPNAGGGWDIFVYPLVDSGAVYDSSYPGASATDVDLTSEPGVSVAYTEDAADLWDSVTVEGDNILVGASLSFADSNLVKGWSSAQETTFRAGATGDAGYASLTPDQKAARNEQLRNAAGVADVFQLIKVKATSVSPTRSAAPGTGSATLPLVPEVSWNGAAVSVSDTAHATPYLPAARLARVVPWLSGVKGDGTDARDAAAKAAPIYLEPRVFKYNASPGTGENVCQDLMVPWMRRPSPTVSPDDRSLGLRISFNPPEIMALNHFTDGVDGVSRINLDHAFDADQRPFDYETILLTVGIPSDQRVSVTKLRYGVPEGQQRRELVITDETLQCWVTLAGTVIGSAQDGTAERVVEHTFVRNDFPSAERLAAMYAAFAFRRRTSISIRLAEPDSLPAWASIGTMVGRLTEQAASGPYPAILTDAYTVVEAIDYTLTYERPRVTISTGMPSIPSALRGQGSNSPASGGPVSQSLGGTIAQSLSASQERLAAVALRGTKSPTSVGREGTVSAAEAIVVVRFDFTGHVDLSEGETDDGEVVWIDGFHAFQHLRIGRFGDDALYRAEQAGEVTRSSSTRPLYRLLGPSVSSPLIRNAAQLELTGTATFGRAVAKVLDGSGASIQTTIDGVPSDNSMLIACDTWLSSGNRLDWVVGGYDGYLAIPDIGRTVGGLACFVSRGGSVVAWSGGQAAPFASATTIIDPGEPFRIDLYAHSEDVVIGSPWRAGTLMATILMRRTGSSSWDTKCISANAKLIVSDTSASSDLVPVTAQQNPDSASFTLALYDGETASTERVVTVSAVNGANGRVTTVSASTTGFSVGARNGIGIAVTGGRTN